MTHRVRRIACRVVARDARQALDWRRALRAQADEVWPRALDAALDATAERLALGERTLRLPRVELRMSARDAAELAEALPQALQAALARWQVEGEAARDDARQGALDGLPDARKRLAAAHAPPEAARDALSHLLATGRLPWDWEALDSAVVASRLRAAALSLLDEIGAVPAAVRPDFAPLQVQRWAAWLDATALDRAGVPTPLTDDLPASAMPAAPPLDTAVAWRLWRWLRDRGGLAPITLHANDAATGAPATAPQAGAFEAVAIGRARGPQDAASPIESDVGPTAALESLVAGTSSLAVERWLAHDAGLVLLHPFLPRLFEACGLIGPGAREIDAARRPHAAALLHWLTTGREGAFEHELTLAKLLLGVAPEAALLPAPRMAREWIDEAQAMLDAAIRHWGALGATGAEGLRLSFLRRQGLLSRGDAAWQLRVMPEAFDVLLGRLPWALSFIRLPWMPWPLSVEWHAP